MVACASIVFSVYIAIWSIVIGLYVADFAALISGLACLAAGVLFFVTAKPVSAIYVMGIGFLCLGFGILLMFLFNLLTVGVVKLSKLIILGIKGLFAGKERE